MRQLEITNKFDNALTGVAGDNGDDRHDHERRQLPRHRQVLRRWATCHEPRSTTTTRRPAANYPHNDDMIIGNGLAALLPGGTLPVYPDGPVCNEPRPLASSASTRSAGSCAAT